MSASERKSMRGRKRDALKGILGDLRKGVIPDDLDNKLLLIILKYHLESDYVEKILEILDDERFEFVTGNLLPSNYSEISKSTVLTHGNSIESEVKWLERFIKDYSQELNEFLKYENDFYRLLLLGFYDEAYSIIIKIEEDICVSVWSIQQKLIHAELSGGFKANKDVLAEVLNQDLSVVVAFLASYSSIRIENNISILQYRTLVNDYLKLLSSKKLEDYVVFKVDFFRDVSIDEFSTILEYDLNLSIIDRYKVFLQVAQYIFSKRDRLSDIEVCFYRSLLEIDSVVGSNDIKNLLTVKDGRVRSDTNSDYLRILDKYTNGDYEDVIVLCIQFLKRKPYVFSVIVIYSKALSYLNLKHEPFFEIESVLNKTIFLVSSIIRRDESFSDNDVFDLFKIAEIFGNHPYSIGIYNFLMSQLPYQIGFSSSIDMGRLSSLTTGELNPSLYQYIDKGRQVYFFKEINVLFPDSNTYSLIRFLEENKRNKKRINYDHYSLRYLKYLGILFSINGRVEDSIKLFDYILNSTKFEYELNSRFNFIEVVKAKYDSLIKLQKWQDAVDIATSFMIDNPSFVSYFFNPLLIEKIVLTNNNHLMSNISVPIYLKFFSNTIDNYYVYVAYDNFLYSKGCEKPRDYFSQFDPYSKKDVQFLEKVCVHDVLYSSPFFSDQDEMDLARIEICNFLNSKVSNYNTFEAEVSELLRKVLVRKGIKQIDYSKIYVDVSGVKEKCTKQLKESFNRNIEIASLPVTQLDKIVNSIGNVLVYYLEEESVVNEQDRSDLDKKLENIKLTSYNRFLLFTESFLKIRDLFLFDSDFGLDTYLSMRIRHGTLPGQLRSIFEMDKLITSIDEKEGKYITNDFWVQRFDFLDAERIEELVNLFNFFSSSVDRLTDNLKNQIIQIATENKKSVGLFDYSYDRKHLLDLFTNRFGTIRDFELFVNAVLETLWERTESILEIVRNYLNVDFVNKMNLLFDQFENNLISIIDKKDNTDQFRELVSVIKRTRTTFIIEIQRVSDWFRRSNKKYIEEFDFDILLNASVNVLKRSFINANININHDSFIKLDGDYFPLFTDIFIYLLQNAIKHSRLTSEQLVIKLHVRTNDDFIIIEMENNIYSDIDYVNQLKERITRSKDLLENPEKFEQAISKEGGTGYPKIKKALVSDLKRKKCDIELGIYEELGLFKFRTSISFEYHDIKK